MQSGYINSANGALIGLWHLQGKRLSGWAARVSLQAEPVSLDIKVDGKRQNVICNTFWSGSLPHSISHRFVGFEYVVGDTLLLKGDVSLQISIGRKDYKSPVIVVPAAPFKQTQLHIDSIGNGMIHGWAWSPSGGHDEPVTVQIDNRRFFTWPNEFRQDLFEAGYSAGACGFRLNLRLSAGPMAARIIQATFRDVTRTFMIPQGVGGFQRLSHPHPLDLARAVLVPQPCYLITV